MMMRNPKPHIQLPHVYLELGGGSAAKGKLAKAWMMAMLEYRIGLLIVNRKHDDAMLVRQVLMSGFSQTRTPYHAYVTQAQYKALSRAFRVEALALEGKARRAAMQGVGNKDYQRFMAIVVRSKRLKMAQKDFAARQWRKHCGCV